MAFADHLDLDTFVLLGTMDGGLPRDTFERERIDPAVLAHLADLRDAGSLTVVEHLDNREIRLADAWNAFIAGTEILWQRVLADGLSGFVLTYAIKGTIDGEKDDVDAAAAMADAYASLCSRLDEGDLVGTTFHPAITPRPHFDDLHCGKTGDRLRLVVEGWKPRLERFDREAKDAGYWVPVEAVEAFGVQTIEIDLPTGVLLMSDYLRAPGIHEALESRIDAAIGDRRYAETHSVGSERGRIAMTRVIAEVADVVQISTTNTLVSIHQDGDRLVVTDGEEVEGMERTGGVCCDRWTVLMADRAHVLALMGDDGTLLDAYLSSEDGGDTTVVNVTPGRWRVTFGEALQDRAEAERLGIVCDDDVWFAMERIG